MSLMVPSPARPIPTFTFKATCLTATVFGSPERQRGACAAQTDRGKPSPPAQAGPSPARARLLRLCPSSIPIQTAGSLALGRRRALSSPALAFPSLPPPRPPNARGLRSPGGTSHFRGGDEGDVPSGSRAGTWEQFCFRHNNSRIMNNTCLLNIYCIGLFPPCGWAALGRKSWGSSAFYSDDPLAQEGDPAPPRADSDFRTRKSAVPPS